MLATDRPVAGEQLDEWFARIADLSADAQQATLAALAESAPELALSLERLLALDQGFRADGAAEPAPPWAVTAAAPVGRVPGFRLLEQIGSGGMGHVFTAVRAADPSGPVYAIKTIRRTPGSQLLTQRFALECDALASLSHPGIAGYVERGCDDTGAPFVVMEYVDGEPIDRWCDRQRASIRRRVELVRQLIDAVEHAHQRLIVHRDIKPANVLVSADGHVTLVDFGVAKSLQRGDLTATAERFLTPHSAAPEQIRGDPIGTACDIHGVGLLLYRLLCGCDPFDYQHNDPVELHRQLLQLPAAPMTSRIAGADPAIAAARGLRSIRELQALIGGDMERVVLRCLRKQPGERYATVRELDRNLGNVLAGRPISERENERLYRFRKFVQRHQVLVAVSTTFAVLLGVAFATTAWQQRLAVHQRDRAEAAVTLLREAFLAANPLSVQGGQTPVSEVLNAALPLLEAEREARPALYADLAATLGQVELAAGRPRQALQLAEHGLQAVQRSSGDPGTSEILQRLRARAALEAGEVDGLRELLEAIRPSSERAAIELAMLRGRLAYLRGERELAVEQLSAAAQGAAGLPMADPLTFEAPVYLARALNIAGRADEAVRLLDETHADQSRYFDAAHPRILLLRMRRLEFARSSVDPRFLLEQTQALSEDIEAAFGARSAMLARAHGNIGHLYSQLDEPSMAARHFRMSWQKWSAAASPQHANALRALFNLTYVLGSTGAPTREVDRLFGRLLEDAEQGAEGGPEVFNYWRVSHLEFLAQRKECTSLLDRFEAYFGPVAEPALKLGARRLLAEVATATQQICDCSQASRAVGCDTAARLGMVAAPADDPKND
jgi:eukaryotic-like serine/threonine-protein kinase